MPNAPAAGRNTGALEAARRRLHVEALEDRQAPAGLTGTAWHDLDRDGLWDSSEPGRPGVTVFIDFNHDGRLDAEEPFRVTDAAGEYSFSGLPAGNYTVTELGQGAWGPTYPDVGPLSAGSVAPAAWEALGPVGGNATAVAASPTNPSIVLAGFNAGDGHGALYRSTDGGRTWIELPGWSDRAVNDIEFTPGGVALVGTRTGLWVSSNGGSTWAKSNLKVGPNQNVLEVAVNPQNALEIWLGLDDAHGAQRAVVLKSVNGGGTWKNVTPSLAAPMRAEAIAFDPVNPARVFVGFAGSPGGGALWVSLNAGSTWVNRSAGLPNAPVLDIVHDGTRLLVTGGSSAGSQNFGLYQSPDAGVTWSAVHTAAWPVQRATDIAVSPANPSVIVLATQGGGVYRSTDGGATWAFGVDGTAGQTIKSVRFEPGNTTHLLAGAVSFGVLRSGDGGASFGASSAGIRELHITSTAVNPLDPMELAVAFASGGTGGIYASHDGGQTWTLETVPAGTWNSLRFAPDGRLYAIGNDGLQRRNVDGTWTSVGPAGAVGLRVVRFGESESNLIYVGGSGAGNVAGIWRSTDGGATWTAVYTGSEQHESVADIEILPGGDGQVVIASFTDLDSANGTKGGVLRSTDGGVTWTPANTGLTTGTEGNALAVSPADPNTVYLADGDSRGASFGGVYRSTDGGLTWARTAAIGAVTEVFADPDDARIVYIGQPALDRVRRSEDGGVTFASFDQGMDGVDFADAAFGMDRTTAGRIPMLFVSTWSGVFGTALYSSRPGSHDVTLGEGEGRAGLNFGARALPGEIRGTVYEDANGNGARDTGEPALAGWTVFLDTDGNGTLDVGEASTVSGSDGAYRFTGLDAGDYTVTLAPQPGWKRTQPGSSGSYAITLTTGGAADGKDFGLESLPGELSGTIWNDADGDGVRDTGEKPLAGWTVYLDQNANGALDATERTTTSNSLGGYVFGGLAPGIYLIAELPPPFWKQTYPGVGNSLRIGGEGPPAGTPLHGWKDRDPSTPNVIDIWYDFRAQGEFANKITSAQRSLVQTALTMWANLTHGRIKFTQNSSADAADIINIGTGDLAAVGGESAPGGVLGLGGAIFSDDATFSLSHGVAWMDMAENWDVIIGNGDPPGTYDYFTIAAHEIGHALGLGHIEGLLWGNIMDEDYGGERTGPSVVDGDRIRAIYGDGIITALGFHVVRLGRGEKIGGLDFGNQQLPIGFKSLSLDFGTVLSPVASGYVRATDLDSYTLVKGYGWKSGQVRSIDRLIGSALVRDFIATEQTTFVVDVPDGDYKVTLTLGDAVKAHDKMGIFLEGKPVATLSTAARNFVTRTFKVTVTDRQLTLDLDDLGGRDADVVLNALRVVRLSAAIAGSNAPKVVTTTATGSGPMSAPPVSGTAVPGGTLVISPLADDASSGPGKLQLHAMVAAMPDVEPSPAPRWTGFSTEGLASLLTDDSLVISSV
ncbi:MAG TPA: SdrD B-like domain-containing protein [Gemmataceae bacterium]|nr:SdrD B-like domain-containing protein [Gemmataceae bacterium]